MVRDVNFDPAIRARLEVTLFPQVDGNLAAQVVGDDAESPVFRVAPDGTVLDGSGPMDTRRVSWTCLDLPDGRKVVADLKGAAIRFFEFTTYDAAGTQLGQFWVSTVGLGGNGSAPPADSVRIVALPDGRVMAGGNFTGGGLLRINLDGTRDAGFVVDPTLPAGWFRGIAALPDGSVVLARSSEPGDSGPLLAATLRRILPDGSIDATYVVTLDDPTIQRALSDGRLLVGRAQLRCLRGDGSIDPTFSAPTEGIGGVDWVEILADGRLLVAGLDPSGDPGVFLLSATGNLILDFLDLFPGDYSVEFDGVDRDGAVWIRHGYWRHGPLMNARVRLDGGAPEAEDIEIHPAPTEAAPAHFVAIDAAGRVLLRGGFDYVDGQIHQGFARLNPDGSVDHSHVSRGIFRDTNTGPVYPDGRLIVFDELFRTDYLSPVLGNYRRLQADGSFDPALPADSDLGSATDVLFFGIDPDENLAAFKAQLTSSQPRPITEILRYSADGSQLPSIPTPDDDALSAALRGLLHPGWVPIENSLPPDAAIIMVRELEGSVLAKVDFAGDLEGSRWVRILNEGGLDPTFFLSPEDEPVLASYQNNSRLADGGFMGRDETGIWRRWSADGTRDPLFAYVPTSDSRLTFALHPSGAMYVEGEPEGLVRLVPQDTPGIVLQPSPTQITAGAALMLQTAVGDAGTVSYQWQRDGEDIEGATAARLYIGRARTSDAGSYRCVILAGDATYITDAVTVDVAANTAKLVNFSGRSRIGAGQTQIGGFVVDDPSGQHALLRAVGSAMPFDLGVPLLRDPLLTLYRGRGAIESDHGSLLDPLVLELGDLLGAFRPSDVIPGGGPGGSALAVTLPPGIYGAHTTSFDDTAGVSLFEFYDADPSGPGSGVRNVSIRALTGPTGDVLIPGFVVRGDGNIRLLIRAVGPSLAGFGVAGAVADPRMILHAHDQIGTVDATNEDWAGDPEIAAAATETGAFPLELDSKDAALLVSLPHGVYSVQVPAANGERGEVLVEIYVLNQ